MTFAVGFLLGFAFCRLLLEFTFVRPMKKLIADQVEEIERVQADAKASLDLAVRAADLGHNQDALQRQLDEMMGLLKEANAELVRMGGKPVLRLIRMEKDDG